MAKTKQEIQMEYAQLCSQLGELHLRRASAQDAIKDMNDSCNTITQKVRNLQKAFAALEAEEKQPAPALVDPGSTSPEAPTAQAEPSAASGGTDVQSKAS